MKKFSKFLLTSVFVVLTGCSTTPNEMRADSKEKGVIQFDLPFNLVRENFLRQAKKCYFGGMNVSYYTHDIKDIKSGELTTLDIMQRGATPIVRVTHSFDIRKVPNGGTEISYFIAGLIVPNYKPAIENWANGREGKCGTVFYK